MPVYEYKCLACKDKFEAYNSIDNASDNVPCPECLSPSNRLFSSFSFKIGIIEPYYDIGLGEVVRGNNDKKRIMKEKGLEYADGLKIEDFNRRKVDINEQNKRREERKTEAIKYMNYLSDKGVPLKNE